MPFTGSTASTAARFAITFENLNETKHFSDRPEAVDTQK